MPAVEEPNFNGASDGRHFLRRLDVRNYKSIARCTLNLRPLSVVVGRNAAGKSNLLDALRFVADALEVTPDHAIKTRGGLDAVRRHSKSKPRNFAVRLDVDLRSLGSEATATYGFEVASRGKGGFVISKEVALARLAVPVKVGFRRSETDVQVIGSTELLAPERDRLFLPVMAIHPQFSVFRILFDALRGMGFYNLNPEAMKALQPPDAGELLAGDGRNIAGVVARLADEGRDGRLREFLQTVVPGVESVERVTLGPRETLRFRQSTGNDEVRRFYAQSMSDGTLRTVGLLVAVMQMTPGRRPASLIGIEEPETALHPAAAGVLVDALREATRTTQVIVTCHSPDLIDAIDVDREQLLVAQSNLGTSEIAPVDAASLDAVRQHLYSAGELLRMDQLAPDPLDLQRQRRDEQLDLFAPAEPAAGAGS